MKISPKGRWTKYILCGMEGGLKKSGPSYSVYSDIQRKMVGRQVEMRADILDKSGH